MTFFEFTKLTQKEIDKNPKFIYTKCKVFLLVEGNYVECRHIKVDAEKDLILSNEEIE